MFFKRFKPQGYIGKRPFSCNYESPLLFGPMFSSFFFGGLYTSIILGHLHSLNADVKDRQIKIEKDLLDIKNLASPPGKLSFQEEKKIKVM